MCWLVQSAQLWHAPTFLLIPLMIIGGIECFAGYHAWRFLLGLNGAVLGFVVGSVLCTLLGAPLWVVAGALVGSAAGAALLAIVVPLGSAVFAFGSVASLVLLLGRLAGIDLRWPLAVGLVLGGVAAVLASARHRPVMITIAAVAGAQQVASAWRARSLPPDVPPLPDVVSASEMMLFAALAAAGLLIQFIPRSVDRS